MHGLEHGALRPEVRARRDPEPADEAGGEVADDVAVEVFQKQDVELLRVHDEFHARRVHDDVVGLDVRVLLCDRPEAVEEEAVRELHDVRLVHGRDPVAAVGAGQEKTSDLVLSALVRGRFGELLAPRVQHGESDLFLLGLLSLIDAMMEMPMAEVLEKIPLDHATKAVLIGQPSVLRPVFQLMLAHESDEWEAAAGLCRDLHLNSEDVANFYWQAQEWAREVSSGE